MTTNFKEFPSIIDAARKFRVSENLVQNLINGHFMHNWSNKIVISTDIIRLVKFLKNYPIYEEIVFDLGSSYFYELRENDPRLELFLFDYFLYHNFLDKFCWILKLKYSSKEEIKKKNYRLDVLFQKFILQNNYLNSLLSNAKNHDYDIDLAIFHLKKGWYNELVRSLPFNQDFLNIGTNIKGSTFSSSNFAWNIIQSYYACYEYMNTMVFTEKSGVDTRQHNKTIKIFSNGLCQNLEKRTLFYPFCLNSNYNKKINFPDYCKYEYASYPRNHNQRVLDLDRSIRNSLMNLAKEEKGEKTLIDFLYKFRVWANYTGIETITRIQDGFYLDFLKRNLGILTFFMGGMSELAVLLIIGGKEFIEIVRQFDKNYISQHHDYNNKFLNPIFIRLRIYKHLGIFSSKVNLDFVFPKSNDPINFLNYSK